MIPIEPQPQMPSPEPAPRMPSPQPQPSAASSDVRRPLLAHQPPALDPSSATTPPPAPRGPARSTVLLALILLGVAGTTLCWQLAGRLPAWEVSGTNALIGLGATLVVIGALASFARSRD